MKIAIKNDPRLHGWQDDPIRYRGIAIKTFGRVAGVGIATGSDGQPFRWFVCVWPLPSGKRGWTLWFWRLALTYYIDRPVS